MFFFNELILFRIFFKEYKGFFMRIYNRVGQCYNIVNFDYN